jgi:hypothetical protein
VRRDERKLKAAARYQYFTVKGTAPDSPNPAARNAGQSKTVARRGLNETAGASRQIRFDSQNTGENAAE